MVPGGGRDGILPAGDDVVVERQKLRVDVGRGDAGVNREEQARFERID
jgi:hypothetical protein